ncbi:hypothetical protein KUTeg_014960 [Tegillarca granosa]|uniref:NAD(P)H oxidase (H2O2-forming) n=1 Tax=Tegillarca granosa TaxID=220873 RepID=A0ABQ9ENQ1_TEGGR|nr:hypothetical protein KUTeg_014960 [Tegillarca granosa]
MVRPPDACCLTHRRIGHYKPLWDDRWSQEIIFVTVLLYNQDVTEGDAVQRFDGWFNNLAFPSWGSVGEPLMQNITTAYEDYTYKPVCTYRPRQLVMFEMTDTDDMTCPVEMLKIPVPKCDRDFDPDCSVRTSFLRQMNSGYLASGDVWKKFPEKNDIELPYVSFPTATHADQQQEWLWKLGDPHVHENPALLSFGVLFFRWHNYLAKKFVYEHPEWSAGEVFYKSRRWVMASLQNIIFYEWLPKLLHTEVVPYKGYNSNLEPGVSAVFDAAAIKYIMTLIPSGISQRTGSCESVVHGNQKALRLCNTYFRSQDILMTREDGVEETLMGLASQLAEKEDLFVVEDLQSKYYGPLHYSRHDFVAQTIMRGRDYGLPDYNTVRKQMGLKTFTNWSDINPLLYQQNPEFYRIRDGDRFWFENDRNGILTKDEIEKIKSIKLYDVIVNSTKIDADEIQKDVFTAVNANCNTIYLKEENLEECYGHKSYDYFAGSEIPFIIIWISFGLIPFICVLVAYIAAKYRQWRHTKDVRKKQTFIHTSDSNTRTLRSQFSDSISDHQAYEWLGFNEDPRPVIVKVKTKCQIGLTSMKGTSLRTVNLEKFEVIETWLSTNKGRTVVMIKIPKEYDLVLQFSNYTERTEFINSFEKAISNNNRILDIQDVKLKTLQNNAFTQKKRNAVLEKFFKTEEFAQAMAVKQNSDFVENMFDLLDSNHDGCITFREFLNAVVLFSKGTAQEKLELVFRMFAAEQNGSLQKEELTKMFRQCGLEDKPVFNFEEFCQILSPQMDKIWNAGIEWKGRKSCYPEKKKRYLLIINIIKTSETRPIENPF